MNSAVLAAAVTRLQQEQARQKEDLKVLKRQIAKLEATLRLLAPE